MCPYSADMRPKYVLLFYEVVEEFAKKREPYRPLSKWTVHPWHVVIGEGSSR